MACNYVHAILYIYIYMYILKDKEFCTLCKLSFLSYKELDSWTWLPCLRPENMSKII